MFSDVVHDQFPFLLVGTGPERAGPIPYLGFDRRRRPLGRVSGSADGNERLGPHLRLGYEFENDLVDL